MKNNKGFSLVELLGAVTIMGILAAIAVMTYTRYIDYSRNKSYKIMRESAISATEEYLMEHPNSITSITFEELVKDEYLERTTDPSDETRECRGKVTIIENAVEDNKLSKNDYEVVICCANYYHTYNTKTKTDTKNDSCNMS